MNHALPQPIGRTWRHWLAAVVLPLAACGGGGGSQTERPAAVARVQITPGSALLTAGAGATQQLSAQAYGVNGEPVDAPVTWSSSRPDQLAISAGGLLTAQAAVGSAQITATAGGISSAPLLALAAKPAAGVVLVDDTNLVGDASDTDANAEPSADNTYQVTLTSLPAPAVGTLMLGRGDKALAGRVVASTSMGTQTLVTMQLVPLDELFDDLRIDEAIDLSRSEVVLPPEVTAQFDVVREGNTWRFTPKPGVTTTSTRERRTSVVGTHARDILPFRNCEVSLVGITGGSASPLRLDAPSIAITLSPTLDARYSSATGLERLVVSAKPDVELGLKLHATAKVTGSVKCTLQLFAFRLPIAGPLAFFIGGLVPVGVGFDLDATTELSSFSAGAKARAFADTHAGIECLAPAGCGFVRDIVAPGATLEPSVELPSALADLRLASKLHAFGYLEAELGNPLLRSLRFKGFDARVGGELTGTFAPPLVQMLDAGFAADYRASLRGRAQVGTGIDNIVRLLSLGTLTKLALDFNDPVASSPRVISVPADRASFSVGDTVNVSVLLDPATLHFLPGIYNVESVELRREFGGVTTVVASQPASPGQSRFDFNVVAPHAGDVADWHVFVTTRLLPVELLSLKLGRAAAAGTEVLLTWARADGVASCLTTARELGGTAPRPRDDQDGKAEGESNPATCLAQAWDAKAEASGIGSGSGPTQDMLAPPTPVTSLSGTASASASATATPTIETSTHVRQANANGYGAGGGEWHLRVQGQAVTMTITGSLSGYAFFRASWAPGSAGAGAPGSYVLDPVVGLGSGTLSHSVRLEPGQTISIRYVVQASALAPPAPPSPTDHLKPGPGGGTASFTVTFTP